MGHYNIKTSSTLIICLFVAVLGLHCCVKFSVVVVTWRPLWGCGSWAFYCGDLSCCRAWTPGFGSCCMWAQLLQFLGSGTGSVVVRRLSCSVLGGILLDQKWNLRLLHWQADSLPLGHHENPQPSLFWKMKIKSIIKDHLTHWAYHCWWERGALGISTHL